MKLNNIEHVYFDLDHTLWDFDRNSSLAFQKIFELHKMEVELNDFLEVYMPVNFRYWELYRDNKVSKEALRYGRLKESFNLLEMDTTDEVIDLLAKDYIKYLPVNNHLLDGTKEVLDYLKPKYKLHIITNGFQEVQHTKMSNSGILEYFETITTSEEAGVKKPHALIFEKALGKSKANASNSVMIGDNYEADIQGAKDFGLHSIFFDYHNKPEPIDEIRIKTLNEITSYL
ncbi:YjjG family noncanonical pyrimidine nucleotidase [Salegentibacter chungangensis]|uniref:YjjG family noncanonical pyrimidine nucleotidase n=1 Tax=Salegentibacter chungangensis TaxID=1335724 RepID=A0ABW3NVX7_9FLAO